MRPEDFPAIVVHPSASEATRKTAREAFGALPIVESPLADPRFAYRLEAPPVPMLEAPWEEPA